MYEVDKINALIEQTLSQEKMIAEANSLEEAIDEIKNTINYYDSFVSKVELLLSFSLLSEDQKKIDTIKKYLETSIETLKERNKELIKIQNEFKYTDEKDYQERLNYIQNLIIFDNISKRIKFIEFNAKKMAKRDANATFITLLSSEGRKKKIYKADVEEYEKLVAEKKKINSRIKKQYKSIIKNYNKEIDYKENYVDVTRTINKVETIKDKKTLNTNDEIPSKIVGYNFQNINHDEWIKTKRNFKNFVIDTLKTKDFNEINKFLEYFNQGLKFNIDFKMDLVSKGYSQESIDFIVNKYDKGPKPNGLIDNLAIKFHDSRAINKVETTTTSVKPKGKIINFVKKKVTEVNKKNIKRSLENVAIFLGVSILVTSTASYAKKIPKLFDDLNNETILTQIEIPIENNKVYPNIEYAFENSPESIENEESIDLFQNEFTVSERAFIYTNMYDASVNSNPIEPYYSSNIKRSVKAIVLKLNNKLLYVNNKEEYYKFVNEGAKPIAVLGMIDGFTEGFYNIDDTNLLGKGITR